MEFLHVTDGALAATASGKLRKKLSAFLRTGSPSRRPRSE
jgi:hypothetical protein